MTPGTLPQLWPAQWYFWLCISWFRASEVNKPAGPRSHPRPLVACTSRGHTTMAYSLD